MRGEVPKRRRPSEAHSEEVTVQKGKTVSAGLRVREGVACLKGGQAEHGRSLWMGELLRVGVAQGLRTDYTALFYQ